MPLINTKNRNWTQNDREITITIARRNVTVDDVDILMTREYVKVYYRPYFCEIYPLEGIDDDLSVFRIEDEVILIRLVKLEKNIWPFLEKCLTKTEKFQIKEDALKCIETRRQSKFDQYKTGLKRVKDFAIEQQIKLDTQQRERIQKVKDDMLNEALKNLKLQQKCRIDVKKGVEIPQPRSGATLEVKFTDREFPTPSRESKSVDEHEWLKKTIEAQRSQGFTSEDLRIEEKNTLFIERKGDQFLKDGNYAAALNAFTFGTQLAPKYYYFYMKRAEVQYAIGNFQKVLIDCSQALDLLKPEVDSNAEFRAVCLSRRAAALRNLQMFEQADDEFQAALKVQPTNQTLKNRLKKLFNS